MTLKLIIMCYELNAITTINKNAFKFDLIVTETKYLNLKQHIPSYV